MKNPIIVVLLTMILVIVASEVKEHETEWMQWKMEFGKHYENFATEIYRYGIWKENMRMIMNHNQLADEGKYSYWMGMNQLGDMTGDEIAKSLNGLLPEPQQHYRLIDSLEPSPDFKPEASVDWRTKGAVTPVKNQGQCGSCYAFSAAGSLEGQQFLKTGKLVSLSVQNILDCSRPEGNMGCEGGMVDNTFRYIIKNHGVDTEDSYPYKAQDEKCHFNASNIGATATSVRNILEGSIDGVLEACSRIGPISAGMDASQLSFHYYKSGIYSEPKCSSTQLDHGILIIGYGTENEEDYFLVKNSWGIKWGMDGYFMISRKNNMCGIATKASYPIV